jgi:UDP-N-acetylglucosamine--N-acetylmuramyl-(pentapeptide) pyrophosphoryl-undecaprenol N-acetylglucosamine transferase
MSVFAVITGGGTAGHVLPALAVAEELEQRGHAATALHYIGAQRGIETRLLPDTPYPHTFLDVVGVQRSASRRNLAFLPKLVRATSTARRLLRALQPRVVVSVGGYASLPAVLAARHLDVPVVVVSFDRQPGRASTLTARFAAASAVAFDGSPLPRAVVTGAPVRRAIRDVDRASGREAARVVLDVPLDRFLVAVTGGSQGSGALNAAMQTFAAEHAGDAGLAIHHVAGERFVAGLITVDDPGGLQHRVVGFEPRMDLVYAAADVLVGRGGASTVAEVAVTGTPSILVPWSAAADDHQTGNVRWLADQGATEHLPGSQLDRLGPLIEQLRADPSRLATLASRAYAAGAVNRRGALGALVEGVALPGRDVTGQ